MGEVTQFPTIKVEEQQLYDMTEELQAMYQSFDKVHELINELELQAAELETVYDAKFDKYVKTVGVENVAVHLLSYCTFSEDIIYGEND